MFITKYSEYKCPYCNYEYKYIKGQGETYEYKEEFYGYETCPNCEQGFLVNNGESIKMPEDKNEVKFHSYWRS